MSCSCLSALQISHALNSAVFCFSAVWAAHVESNWKKKVGLNRQCKLKVQMFCRCIEIPFNLICFFGRTRDFCPNKTSSLTSHPDWFCTFLTYINLFLLKTFYCNLFCCRWTEGLNFCVQSRVKVNFIIETLGFVKPAPQQGWSASYFLRLHKSWRVHRKGRFSDMCTLLPDV